MQVTLIQGLLIALFAIIAGIDFWLEGFYIFRPMIVCTVTGAILGNLTLGIIAGGLTELAFAGLTPVGGTQPPNPIMAGIMTVVLAYTTGKTPATAIGLALPFSILMQYIILFYYSAFSVLTKKLDTYAANGETKKFTQLALLPTWIVALSYGLIAFLCVYGAQEPMKVLVNSMPVWLSHGFEIAGSILPAVGFGLLLKSMLKAEYVPYLLLGFTAACFIKFGNLMPVAVIGVALAFIEYYHNKRNQDNEKKIKTMIDNASGNGDDSDGI
ncbi:N-acetylgalactosamine PTS, EIIC [Lactobacillus plantarum JDM1] [Lactiplantibacillus mudanjiangensis]|uniref:PTS galactosamine transporter subunit IIC n=1 Tax=Lactiplantibacillus mudanjiangensis TaxID=1296538 RepID=UPI00101573CB|nr:PTS galactosamine transporter subunit IIC [Lactiplantibacillus mudanjiangensis]VDG20839.1 N-acetylgalactosamine PTS, EIIC [Lactobacillus plantarum JDM1] [Lactiplantibacillus mudanjiangensis]VDG32032.1 N-acetylgalactosamine PTS, EIIC [Lactobacillus plantarum JDM1] [Lactiplantibacillus mudanjiangensis]